MSPGAKEVGPGVPPPGRPRFRLAGIWPVALLWALCFVDYGRIVLPGPWPRQYIANSDFSRQFFPFQRFVAGRLAAGHLPTWNPYLFAGHPQLADPQSAVYSPLGLLLNLTVGRGGLTYLAMEWRAVLDYLLAALFSYLWFRRVASSQAGGALGALCFTFGGFLSSYPLPQLPVLETILWLPLVLYALDRALAPDGGVGWAAGAGLAGGALLLAGHAQTALLAGYGCLAFAAWRLVGMGRGPARAIALAGCAAAIAAGLGAAQWLPTLEFARESTRAHLTFVEAGGGYRVADFRQLLLPGGIFERTYYVGVVPLALALVGALRREGRFWLGLWLVSAVVSLGAHTPLFRVLYAWGPGFAAFRDQERAAGIAAFASCALAAQGAAHLLRRAPAHARPLAVAFGALLAVPTLVAVALLWPAGSTPGDSVVAMPARLNLVGASLMGATAAGLAGLAAARLIPARALAPLLLSLTAANLLAVGANLSRAPIAPEPPPELDRTLRWLADRPDLVRVGNSSDHAITNNLGTLYGVAGPIGDSPIQARRTADLVAGAGGYRVWQLFNVGFVVTRRPPGAGFEAVHAEGDLLTYRMLYGLPRAWAVRDVRVAGTPDEARRQTAALDQPGAAVVLEGRPGVMPASPDLPRDQHIEWRRDEPGDVALDATTTDDAVLVLSIPFVHGWEAADNGHAAPLYHADLAMMALDLPAGSHHLTAHYRQPGLLAGLGLAALALAGGMLGAVWPLISRRRRALRAP